MIDAFGLVVMHPMRRVRKALHAVEVGHFVAVGLGEVGAEVGVALSAGARVNYLRPRRPFFPHAPRA